MAGTKIPKTNAMRILDKLGIGYEIQTYDFDIDHISGIDAAKKIGVPAEQVYKTICMINNEKQIFVFCTPVEFEISLKKAREITGSKSIDLLKVELLQKNTGYIRGGCSPLGMIRQYPTYIEELCQLEDYIYVSAGLRGVQIKLKPADLLEATGGQYVSFT